jgi:transposase
VLGVDDFAKRRGQSYATGHGRLATRSRERHAAIHDLLARGRNYTQISEMLGLTRHTVRKFARAATADQVITGPSPRSSRLGRFAPYQSRGGQRQKG